MADFIVGTIRSTLISFAVRILSFAPTTVVAYWCLIQFFIFTYLPCVVVLACEDARSKLITFEYPLKRYILLAFKLPHDIFTWICPYFNTALGIHTRDDSNAIAVALVRHLFAGMNPPIAIPIEELLYTRAFLPFHMLFLGELGRNYVSPEFLSKSHLTSLIPFIARSNYVDDILLSSLTYKTVRQVINLGAGYDTRAYRFAEKRRHPEFKGRLSYTSVIEIDQPSVQQRKRKLLVNSFNKETLSYVEKYVIYIPCTFDDHNTLLRALDRNPEIDPNLNTLFIMEGVTPYITREIFEQTIHTLRLFRGKAKSKKTGHYILFDIHSTEKLQQIYASQFFDIARVLTRSIVGHPEVTISSERYELKQELSMLGLSYIDDKDYDLLVRYMLRGFESKIDLSFLKSSITSGVKWVYAECLPLLW